MDRITCHELPELFQGAAVALTAAALYKSLHEEKTEAVLTEVKA